MSTINQWNTNFTYGEYLTSANMNSSSVGYICPGVYNSDIYLRRSATGSLSIVLKKGTTIVFSHVKDENGNMDFNDSYNYCTKCIVTEDTDYVIYNPDTDRNNGTLTSILTSDIFYIYIMKKVVSTNDSSDYIPIIGLLSFSKDDQNSDLIRRNEYTIPSIGINTIFNSESTKAYYQLLGVVINTYNGGNDIFNGVGALSENWLTYHIFTTRCLPSYSLRNSLYDSSYHNDIYFLKNADSKEFNNINWGVNYKNLYINGNIYNNEISWKNIYKWYDTPESTSLNNLTPIVYDPNNVVSVPSTSDNLVKIDFFYAITDCEQSGPDNISDIFKEGSARLSLNCLSFIIDDANIRTASLLRNSRDTTDIIEYRVLYTDNSITTINRLLNLIKGKNILPRLFNYIRYNRGTLNSDTIIPIAMCFRPQNLSENEKEEYLNTYLDPNNTLSFFDLQDGNYNLNYCMNYFQMADILSALDDNIEN